jgi:hypothetical protein
MRIEYKPPVPGYKTEKVFGPMRDPVTELFRI